MDDLTLPERFLLLALEERSGEFAGRQAPLDVARGLIGMALFELYLRGHIRFLSPEEMRVIRVEIEALLGVPLDLLEAQWPGGFRPLRRAACQVADGGPVGDPFLDATLDAVRSAPPASLRLPFATFGATAEHALDAASGGVPDLAARRLLARGVLVLDEKKGLGGATRPLLPTEKHEPRHQLIASLRDVVLNRRPAVEGTVALLGVLRTRGLLGSVFAKDERDKADWRILELARPDSAPHSPVAGLLAYVSGR